jgi:hypothetical protein
MNTTKYLGGKLSVPSATMSLCKLSSNFITYKKTSIISNEEG